MGQRLKILCGCCSEAVSLSNLSWAPVFYCSLIGYRTFSPTLLDVLTVWEPKCCQRLVRLLNVAIESHFCSQMVHQKAEQMWSHDRAISLSFKHIIVQYKLLCHCLLSRCFQIVFSQQTNPWMHPHLKKTNKKRSKIKCSSASLYPYHRISKYVTNIRIISGLILTVEVNRVYGRPKEDWDEPWDL